MQMRNSQSNNHQLLSIAARDDDPAEAAHADHADV